MVRFEKAFTSLESIGNAYDFMVLCSTACDVTLAQDRATIEAMPNGSENLSIYSDNDIETYRDVLFYVGQVLGGFFVINRAGELELRKYGLYENNSLGNTETAGLMNYLRNRSRRPIIGKCRKPRLFREKLIYLFKSLMRILKGWILTYYY